MEMGDVPGRWVNRTGMVGNANRLSGWIIICWLRLLMESVIVFIVVAVTVVIGGYSFYKTATGKKSGCGCSVKCSDSDCDLKKIENANWCGESNEPA